MKGQVLAIALCLTAFTSIAQQEPTVFFDDLEKGITGKWQLDSPRSWQVEEGALVTSNYSGNARIKEDFGEDFAVQARVKPMEPDPKLPGGFGGVTVSGVNFVIRTDGFWWPYKKPEAERYSGGLRKAEITLGRWYQFKIVRRSGGDFEWYVDGERICEIIEPAMKGDVGLFASRLKTAYDDIRVSREPAQGEAGLAPPVNLIRNSSFEILQDNLPLYWAPIYRWDIETFFRDWQVVQDEKYDGASSLRIARGGVHSWISSTQKGKPYTFSVYMKSDKEDLPVKLTLWEWNIGKMHTKQVTVGKTWQRYSHTAEKTTTDYTRVRIEIAGDATLWLDAAQLEEGVAASAYHPNPLDTKRESARAEVPLPETRLPKVSPPPVIDGRLDDPAWKTAVEAPPFMISTDQGGRKPPREQTKAWLCCDNQNIYVGFKCYDSQMAALKATVKESGGPVWTDDCVETFLDRNLDRKSCYHFAVNPLGTQFVRDKITNTPWQRTWLAKASIQKDFWVVEIALPLASLDISPTTPDTWGINLGRENHRAAEYSCTAPVSYMNFHDVAHYGLLKWPDKALFSPCLFALRDLALKSDAAKGSYALEGALKNNTGSDANVQISAEVSNKTETSEAFPLKNGEEKRFSFGSFSGAEGKDAWSKVIVTDTGNKRVCREENFPIVVSTMMEPLLHRSYYTKEKEAEIVTSFNLRQEDLKDTKVVVKLRRRNETLVQKSYSVTGPTSSFPLPIGDVPVGEYFVDMALMGNQGELARASQPLRKLPPKANEVKVDRIRRVILVDDKPFFVFAPLETFFFAVPKGADKVEQTMEHWAKNGFKAIIAVSRIEPFSKTKDGWTRALDAAHKNGVKLIFWGRWPSKEVVEAFRDHPALLAWLVEDEPEICNVKPDDVVAAVNKVRVLDPYHPVYVNYTPIGPAQRWAGLPGDIISTDLYITGGEGRSLEEVVDLIHLKEKIAAERHIPTWMFLVGNNVHNHYREPTAEEQEAQTYGALIVGCTGLKYFLGQPFGRRHWDRYKQLNQEIEQLTPVIFSTEAVERVDVSPPSILAMTRRHQGKVYVIAANIEDKPVSASFDLSRLGRIEGSEATVLSEDRKIGMVGPCIKDGFRPFQRHVYEVR